MKDAETTWKFAYEDLLEYLEELKEEKKMLFERIWSTKSITGREKEKLFNEATVEVHNEIQRQLERFSLGCFTLDF
jgi:hypothetical protein